MTMESENQVTVKRTDDQPIIPNVDKFWISVITVYLILLGTIFFLGSHCFFPVRDRWRPGHINLLQVGGIHAVDLPGDERDTYDRTGVCGRRTGKPGAWVSLTLLVCWEPQIRKKLDLNVFPAAIYRINIEFDLLFCNTRRVVFLHRIGRCHQPLRIHRTGWPRRYVFE